MKFKRLLLVVFAVIMIAALASCDNNTDIPDDVVTDDQGNVHTHSYTEKIERAASCSDEGVRLYICDCGDSHTQVIEKTAHSWLAADCEYPKRCAVCGETEGEAKGHSYSESDCENPATCANCGLTEGEAVGHTWVDANCTTPKTCSVCGKTDGDQLKHSWQKANCQSPMKCTLCGVTSGEKGDHVWLEADCENPVRCAYCGVTNGDQLGHKLAGGDCRTSPKCTVCGEIVEGAAQHSWKVADCTNPQTCTVCGMTVSTPLGHSWIAATCQSPEKCDVCGETRGEVSNHVYVNGKCKYCSKDDEIAIGEADIVFSDGRTLSVNENYNEVIKRWGNPEQKLTEKYVDGEIDNLVYIGEYLVILRFDHLRLKGVFTVDKDVRANEDVFNKQIYADTLGRKGIWARYFTADGFTGGFEGLQSYKETELLMCYINNAIRNINGLNGVYYSEEVSEVARKHSQDMAKRDYFDHVTPEGNGPDYRLNKGGVNWYVCGENIVAGYRDMFGAMNAWYNSEGHRSNMLDSRYEYIGMAIAYDSPDKYEWYVTQNFIG